MSLHLNAQEVTNVGLVHIVANGQVILNIDNLLILSIDNPFKTN